MKTKKIMSVLPVLKERLQNQKNIVIITAFSLIACVLYTGVLYTPFNDYLFSSVFKTFVFILAPMIYFAISKNEKFTDMFPKGDKKYIKLSLLLGIAVIAIIAGIFIIIRPFIEKEMIVNTMLDYNVTDSNFPFFFIHIVLINAGLEEIFFRGFVFLTIYKTNRVYAHLYSSILFSLYHVSYLNNALNFGVFLFSVIALVIAGIIFNLLVVKCKNLSGALIVHMSANLALNLIMAYYVYLE